MSKSPISSRSAAPVTLPLGLVRDWAAAQNFNEALDVLAIWLPELMTTDRASTTLFTSDRSGLEVFRLSGASAIPTGTILPLEGTSVGQVVQTRQVLNIPSLAEATYTLEKPGLLESGLRSVLNAPLLSSGECFGSLNVARKELDGFSETDELLLGGLAEVLGCALQMQRLLETERDFGNTDALTGLANRRSILDSLTAQLEVGESNSPVLFVDLDGFKVINDAYGHPTGDALLKELARRIIAVCEPDHSAGRIGGDEFLVLCGPGTSRAAALEVAHRLIESCQQPLQLGSIVLQPRLSVGLTVPADDGATVSELLAQADRAMYKAKRTGVSLVEADANLRHEADVIAAIDHDLDKAIATDAIEFHYQPIRHLRSGKILGCEALIRWFHPEVGLVPPPLLIERAEITGRIDAMTTWAIDRVARNLSWLRQQNSAFHDKAFGLNLSPRQFGWSEYVDTHIAVLKRYDLRPEDIVVEVVESGTIEVETTAETTIRALAEQGANIALDDFGTGHNVIRYFSRFPIHCIKIDRSMISSMVDHPTVRTIVKGLTQIATDLNIMALGEGIETRAELDACIEVGLKVGQGYFLDRPMPLCAFAELLSSEFPDQPPRHADGFAHAAGNAI